MEKNKLQPEDLDRGLLRLPGLIARAAEKASEKREALDRAKLKLKVAEAEAYIKCRHTGDVKKTESEIKAQVTRFTEDVALEVIKAEGEWRQAEITVDELANNYISVRKAASLEDTKLNKLGDSYSKREYEG